MKFNLNIDKAIQALEKNLADHVTELQDATEVWTDDVIQGLEKFRKALDRKGLDANALELNKLFREKPVDTRKQYSKYLGGLRQAKASGDTHVTVDEDDYDRIFNDNWEWRAMSKTSNAVYASRKS